MVKILSQVFGQCFLIRSICDFFVLLVMHIYFFCNFLSKKDQGLGSNHGETLLQKLLTFHGNLIMSAFEKEINTIIFKLIT